MVTSKLVPPFTGSVHSVNSALGLIDDPSCFKTFAVLVIITGPSPVWSVKRVDCSDTTYLNLGFQDQEHPPNLAFETVHSENLNGQSRQQGAPSHHEPNENEHTQ